MLSFTDVYFFGFGAFQWVTDDSNKNVTPKPVLFSESDLSQVVGKCGRVAD
jgi:hypothetical protein